MLLVYFRGSKGNALFIILIVVALFAALSYAVTQSGRSSGTISREQNALYATQIVQLAGCIKMATLRLELGGTPSTSIFTNTPTNQTYAGGGTINGLADFCTTGTNCLFAPEGGGLAVQLPPKGAFLPSRSADMWWANSYFAGAGSYNGLLFDGLTPGAGPPGTAVAGIGTAAPDDLVAFQPLKKEVCTEINKGLGISGIPIAGSFSGAEAACIDWVGNGSNYLFYQVLKAR